MIYRLIFILLIVPAICFADCANYSNYIFCDDFEGRATGQTEIDDVSHRWMYNWEVHTGYWPTYPTNELGSVQITDGEYFDGSRAFEVYQQDNDCGNPAGCANGQGRAWIGDDEGGDWEMWEEADLDDEMYARVYIKFEDGFQWQTDGNQHHIFLWIATNSESITQNRLNFYIDYVVTPARKLDIMMYSHFEYIVDQTGELQIDGVAWDGGYKGLDLEGGAFQLEDDTWYKCDVYLKWNTFTGETPNADGAFKFWVNDTLFHDAPNSIFRSSVHKTMGIDRIGPAPNTPDKWQTQDQSIWYDDIILSAIELGTPKAEGSFTGAGTTAHTGAGTTTWQ